MQAQVRVNNEEFLDYLKSLESWEDEMREKDQALSKNRSILKESLPPVRSRVKRSRKDKKKGNRLPAPPASRIHSYDYKAWDKFDVDRACEEVDYEVESSSGSEGDCEEGGGEGGGRERVCEEGGVEECEGGEGSSEEEEMERQRALSMAEKEKGNALYKDGDYEAAVECYSRGMMLDPLSAALPANRALALLKLDRYAAVEKDCNTALALDDSYMKAYLRRGVARRHLGNLSEAIEDFEQVLKVEPKNKQAVAELKTTQQLKQEEERRRLSAEGHVFPVKRPTHLRSKKPLRRVVISEIGGQEETMDSQTLSTHTQASTNTQSQGSRETAATDTQNRTSSHMESVKATRALASPKDTALTYNSAELTVSSAVRGPQTSCVEDVCETVVKSSAESEVRSGDGCADVPPVPETTFQLQSDWKNLRPHWPLLVTYFKQLPPERYPMLLQQSLETAIFSDIILILTATPGCVNELTWLTRVPRFSVAVMFLSKTDRSNLQCVFAELMAVCRDDSERETVKTLSAKYGVNS